MAFYVIAFGATLFAMVGAGIALLDSRSGTYESGTGVTTITPSSSDMLPPSAPTDPLLAPSPSPSVVSVAPSKDRITTIEDLVTELINKERAGTCSTPLRTDERLRKAARAHSADMAKNDYFDHVSRDGSSFVDRIARAGYPRGSAASENIAMGYRTAQAVVDGWMNSAGHRRNILSCSSKAVGLGLAYRNNTPYWTQDFGRS